LIDQIQKKSYMSGYHSVKLNASAFPPGIYFYTVGAGEKSASGKMSVIR
jgi:hypothetical protein